MLYGMCEVAGRAMTFVGASVCHHLADLLSGTHLGLRCQALRGHADMAGAPYSLVELSCQVFPGR